MSDFRIESPEERRRRYLKLARAATEAAAKTPLPGPTGMYIGLAEARMALAEERAESGHSDSYDAQTEISPRHAFLHAKLKDCP